MQVVLYNGRYMPVVVVVVVAAAAAAVVVVVVVVVVLMLVMVGLAVCAGNIPAGECTQVGGRVTVRLGAAEEAAGCGETACRRHRSHGGSCQGTDGDSTCQYLSGS